MSAPSPSLAPPSLALFSLAGQTALVTGASRGLGAAMAEALAGAGATVVLVARTPAHALAASIAQRGDRAHVLAADLGTADTEALVAEAEALAGPIDLLVNNAGIIRRAPVLEFSAADWDDVVHLNLTVAFRLSQAVARRCVARRARGKIVQIASMLSFQGGIRVPAYTAAKSGLLGLTRALANELAAQGINVNAIAPGYMATDNTAPLRADADRHRAILERIPAGRWGQPDDLAGAVIFLCSTAADYVHGAVLPVDGGWLAR